ncbi:hypothetical protein D9615_007270 [Tricholomella constricta]|uniref:DUF6534 domain-containing protein n=1 Tax=Tricholomella constricta TaxID=117010 RepID=A0A8H5H5E6_9AGAR|nr:hypothetical protein D9615_007270 [Tricholomella constricta]
MVSNPAQIAGILGSHGPMLIGTMLNILLYGITITQTYLYYTASNRDNRWIKTFVYFLFIADTVQTVFTVVYMYDTLINHFGDIPYLATANWLFSTDPALTVPRTNFPSNHFSSFIYIQGIIGGMVQGFFAWRIRVLTGSITISLIIIACSIASILMGIATAIAIGIVPNFVEFQRFKVVVIICAAGVFISRRILITSTLVVYLKRHRTGFVRTDSQIDRIIRLAVQTGDTFVGLITAIWAFVDLVLYLLNPSGLHLLFNFPLSKLYTNALMSSLNARTYWQYDSDDNANASRDSSQLRDRNALYLTTLKSGGL